MVSNAKHLPAAVLAEDFKRFLKSPTTADQTDGGMWDNTLPWERGFTYRMQGIEFEVVFNNGLRSEYHFAVGAYLSD